MVSGKIKLMLTRSMTPLLLLLALAAPSLTHGSGHMKPFGCCTKKLKLPEVEGFLAPEKFVQEHVRPLKPVVMRGAARSFTAFTRWTDKYFRNLPDTEGWIVHPETLKKENRNQVVGDMSFGEFLQIYNKTEHYVVESVPSFLGVDVQLPFCMQCEAIMNNLMDMIMWFSSGGTNSVVHTDSADNLNCVMRGSKKFVMVDPALYGHKVDMDHPEGAYMGVDVDAVDYEKYPGLADVEFYHVEMQAGDCLYIPFKWIHQVRSFGSNLAINFWFYHYAVRSMDLSKCRKENDPSITIDTLRIRNLEKIMEQGPDQVRDFLAGEVLSDTDGSAQQVIQRILAFVLMTAADTDEDFEARVKGKVTSMLVNVFTTMDTDRDSVATQEEVSALSDEEVELIMEDIQEAGGVAAEEWDAFVAAGAAGKFTPDGDLKEELGDLKEEL